MNRQFLRHRHSFGHLQSILSKMKVAKGVKYPDELAKLGTSDLFNYATNKQYKREELKTNRLEVWNRLQQHDTVNAAIRAPTNGFEEAILLTEQGRLWTYPIDNEIGMDAEKEVPFEEHIFLEKHLEGFPDNEYIQTFMGFVLAGLAKNPWMTADRKRQTILWYKDYFEAHEQMYKKAGFDLFTTTTSKTGAAMDGTS